MPSGADGATLMPFRTIEQQRMASRSRDNGVEQQWHTASQLDSRPRKRQKAAPSDQPRVSLRSFPPQTSCSACLAFFMLERQAL